MSFYIEKLDEEQNVFGDEIAKVELWDFSRANTNDESRIEAITTVASICYDNPNVIGKENLYNRLKAEAMGLPSSSFEFVPILLDNDEFDTIVMFYVAAFRDDDGNDDRFILNIEKYGQWIIEDGVEYLLTNYRALLADHERIKNVYQYQDITQFYNDEADCKVIEKYSKTFLYKMDISTSKQHNRHRVSLQELSRRYVSGKKTKFEFYHSTGLKVVESTNKNNPSVTTESLTDMMIDHYFAALDAGVKAQEARRILPQSMYTTIWSSFLPFQLDNYLALRDDLHAQQEIMWLSQAMKRLLKVA
jgi:thymidylate synthase (FAD)